LPSWCANWNAICRRILPVGDDFRLLREQADRCRAILTRLSQPEQAVSGAVDRMPLGALLDDIATPHRGFDVAITIELDKGPPPKVWRAPEIVHSLGNLIENAADFAAREVRVRAHWDQASLTIEVADDGPGFAGEIMERIGEPYVTSRPAWRSRGQAGALGKQEGMGLGFFIAKTLVEQTGGTLTAQNRDDGGASVTARWPRGAIDGEKPPSLDFWL
jgi:two-component system, sensor histidine kinase RegB